MSDLDQSRCEWNPATSRNATTPESVGDCPNQATISVGATGRWHLCASCAALPFFDHLRTRKPIGEELTGEARAKQVLAMTPLEYLRDMLARAREALMLPSVESASAKTILNVFGHLLDDKRATAAVLRAVRKLSS